MVRPPIVGHDDQFLYLLADFGIVRVPTQGGDAEPASQPREYGIAAATVYEGYQELAAETEEASAIWVDSGHVLDVVPRWHLPDGALKG